MKTYLLTVEKIIDETPDAYSLHLRASEPELLKYKPGQYITLKLNVKGEELRRAFSLSSSPVSDKNLVVTIKRVPNGRASNFIRDTFKAGDSVNILPPMGKFAVTLNPANAKHYVLIGAGSGITPLMSMVKSILQAEANSVITLWYGNRTEKSIIFKDELDKLQKKYGKRLSITYLLTQSGWFWRGEKGRLDKKKVTDLLAKLFMKGDSLQKLYYICGPNEMMQEAQKALEEQGVNMNDVFREYYSAPAPTDAEAEKAILEAAANAEKEAEIIMEVVSAPKGNGTPAKIILDGKSYDITVRTGQYVLDAAVDAGIDPPYACQAGICTTCRAKLLKGKVHMDEKEGLSDQEIDEGFVLTCQSKCVSDEPIEVEYL